MRKSDGKKLFRAGISFQEFVNLDQDSYKEKTLKIYNNIKFSEETTTRVKNINKEINVLVCAEIWCPDCMINVPVVEKMRELNKNIQIAIVGRQKSETFLKRYFTSESIKIPTIIIFDEDFNGLGSFVERPNVVKEIENSENQPAIIVTMRKYKNGEYTEETLKDMLDIIDY